MEEQIKSFLTYLTNEKRYSANTLASYSSDLRQLCAYAESQRKAKDGTASVGVELNAQILAGYMRNLRERKYTLSTVARKVAAAKSFLKFLTETGRLRDDLSPQLASPHVNKSAPRPLSISEVRRLLAEPGKARTFEGKRDKAMLELLYATGLRASEMVGLNVKDIDVRGSKVHCSGRNLRARLIPIDQHIIQILKEYMAGARSQLVNNEEENALFVNHRGERLTRQGFWKIIQGYADKIGLKNEVTPRALRHSFAVHRLKGGTDLQSVQQLLGHAHVSTTRVYKQAEARS
ncbi:MAG: tyrosine recombinase XerD [Chloroflexi bacterium]|nr:tyrosine recombinase XerD [Chloroflexota bacterium]MBM4453998.1 tyrosine recombinase XerD [Chloroflexota bacterium]